MHVSRDILDFFKFQFAYSSGKKPFLFNIYYAPISNNPDVEIIINPNQERNNPKQHEKCIFQKKKEFSSRFILEFRKKQRQPDKASDEDEEHHENDKELA